MHKAHKLNNVYVSRSDWMLFGSSNIEKVPRGIKGEKSSKEMASSMKPV